MPVPHDEFMLMGRVGETLFERAWMLMGMEGLMVAFYESPERLKELFARIAAVRSQMVARHIAAGCEAVIFADDYGGQDGMLISPASWREFIKPHLAALYRQAKQAGMMVVQHSCGCNGPILGDLVEMGLDVWHPCQPTSNDLAAIKRQFAGRLTFYGAIDSYVLDRGTPDDVRAEVRLRIRQLAAGGGFIAAPSHGVPYRKENLDAMADEIAKVGRYGTPQFDAVFKEAYHE
jgi:uroporphyrinogen decarboxylase